MMKSSHLPHLPIPDSPDLEVGSPAWLRVSTRLNSRCCLGWVPIRDFRKKSTSQLIQVVGSCRAKAPTSLLAIGWWSLSAPRGCSPVQSWDLFCHQANPSCLWSLWLPSWDEWEEAMLSQGLMIRLGHLNTLCILRSLIRDLDYLCKIPYIDT